MCYLHIYFKAHTIWRKKKKEPRKKGLPYLNTLSYVQFPQTKAFV